MTSSISAPVVGVQPPNPESELPPMPELTRTGPAPGPFIETSPELWAADQVNQLLAEVMLRDVPADDSVGVDYDWVKREVASLPWPTVEFGATPTFDPDVEPIAAQVWHELPQLVPVLPAKPKPSPRKRVERIVVDGAA